MYAPHDDRSQVASFVKSKPNYTTNSIRFGFFPQILMQMKCILTDSFFEFHISRRYSYGFFSGFSLHSDLKMYHILVEPTEINTEIDSISEKHKNRLYIFLFSKSISFLSVCCDEMFWCIFLCLVASVLFAYKSHILLDVTVEGKQQRKKKKTLSKTSG